MTLPESRPPWRHQVPSPCPVGRCRRFERPTCQLGTVESTESDYCELFQRVLIRGHHGSAVFGNGEEFTGFDFVAERSQVTQDSSIQNERVEVGGLEDPSWVHLKNFVDAARAGAPEQVRCSLPSSGSLAVLSRERIRVLPRQNCEPHSDWDLQISEKTASGIRGLWHCSSV